jgi:1-deoxy-D-xylulose-5-phosphate reductoisomerase
LTSEAEPIRVALLGSTGSIGRQALEVFKAAGPDRFQVVAMAAGRDATTFQDQLHDVRPRVAALADGAAAASLEPPPGTELSDAEDALEQFAVRDDIDLLVVATGGVVSLRPILAALRRGTPVATANKETLVAGGHLVMPLARDLAADHATHPAAYARHPADRGAAPERASPLFWLRPIDSEHSAIWQCLVGERLDEVERLILTASGGPFRTWSAERIAAATPDQALAHPNWSMGSKISIDSASLMNKGLEVIEARWLYDLPYARIDVLVHPESLIHSLVEFVDGSLKAQLGLPDMRIPIQYAVSHPRRVAGPAPRLDLLSHDRLTFEPVDETRFPALQVARDAGAEGPRATAALIAADEVAVRRFLLGSLTFDGIAGLARNAVDRFGVGGAPELDELIQLDAEVREWAAAATVTGGIV